MILLNGRQALVCRRSDFIGGARLADELDARRAIYDGAILGNRI
jgi:hypothetical protein